jgi:hypothetical protein
MSSPLALPEKANKIPTVKALRQILGFSDNTSRYRVFKTACSNFKFDYLERRNIHENDLRNWGDPAHRDRLAQMASTFLSEYGSRFWSFDSQDEALYEDVYENANMS